MPAPWNRRSRTVAARASAAAATPHHPNPTKSAITMPTHSPALGILALLVATSAWGGMFLVSKGVLAAHRPGLVHLVALHHRGADLRAAADPARRGAVAQAAQRRLVPLSVRGLAGFGVFSVMLLAGLAHSLPSHGAVIMATMPMTTQLLRWLLDGVRPARVTLLTSVLALAGVAVVSGAAQRRPQRRRLDLVRRQPDPGRHAGLDLVHPRRRPGSPISTWSSTRR